MFCICLLAFWRLTLGELWWFRDALDTTVAEVLTFFQDAISRPAVLAFVSLIWARDVSSVLPKGCLAILTPSTPPGQSPSTATQLATAPPNESAVLGYRRSGSGVGKATFGTSVTDDTTTDHNNNSLHHHNTALSSITSDNYNNNARATGGGQSSTTHNSGRGAVYSSRRGGSGGANNAAYSPKSDDEYEHPTTLTYRGGGEDFGTGDERSGGGTVVGGGGIHPAAGRSRQQEGHHRGELDVVPTTPSEMEKKKNGTGDERRSGGGTVVGGGIHPAGGRSRQQEGHHRGELDVVPTTPSEHGGSANSSGALSRVGSVWAHALAYVGLARAYVLGDDGAALATLPSSQQQHTLTSNNRGMAPPTTVPIHRGGTPLASTSAAEDAGGPWEQRVRWRLVLATRWIALMLVCWSGLYIGLLTWTSTKAPVACGILQDPESTGCFAVASGNHIVYVEPRVYTVVALLTNAFLFASTVWSGVSHLERIGHLRSRRTFRLTLLRASFFQAGMIFCLFCKIFSNVRFNGGWYVFFTFCEDVAMMGYLWTLVYHIETAAKRRRATGKVADTARFIKEQVIRHVIIAKDTVKTKVGRWWAKVWRVERSTEPHSEGANGTPLTINRGGNMNANEQQMASFTPVLMDNHATPMDMPGGGNSTRGNNGTAATAAAKSSSYSLGGSITGASGGPGASGVVAPYHYSSQHSRTSSGIQRMNSTFDFLTISNPQQQQLQQTTTTNGSDTVANAANLLESSAFSPSQRQPPSVLDVNELNMVPPPSRRSGGNVGNSRGNVGSSKTISRPNYHNDASSAASASSSDHPNAPVGTDGSTPREGLGGGGVPSSGRSTRAPSSAVTSEPPGLLGDESSSPLQLLEADHVSRRQAHHRDPDGLKPSSQSTVDHIAELLENHQRHHRRASASAGGGGGPEDTQLEGTLTSTQNSNFPLDSLFSFVDPPRTPQEGGGGGTTTSTTAASPHGMMTLGDAGMDGEDVTEEMRDGEGGDVSLTDRTSGSASHNR
ncbi:membrane-associated protein, putative [Bodo saltans]|uniref:Membrane-associated protein, putative n=1 Tax=Bodo saltans TaxID=75058 RepID=A0A0S4IYN4_BODSA|nr:membrane-associated protein, putative [Bodo saltans]|eukprot:CUG23563.1 membrane-associated protein, putative [Bodo saltans]